METRRVSSIRQYPIVEESKVLARASVLSELDYCNPLLSGCPLYPLSRLQKVQISAVKLVFKACKRDHVRAIIIIIIITIITRLAK